MVAPVPRRCPRMSWWEVWVVVLGASLDVLVVVECLSLKTRLFTPTSRVTRDVTVYLVDLHGFEVADEGVPG